MAKPEKKSKKKKVIIGSIVIALLLIVVLLNVRGKKEIPIVVQTEKVVKRNITQIVEAPGKINPKYKVVITAEVTGEIVDLPVKEGDKVKKGDLLLRIKPDTYTAQKDRAAANLQSSKATLRMKETQLDLAHNEFSRTEAMFKSGFTNKQEMDRIKSELISAKAQFDAQNAVVRQAEASLVESNESLNKTAIYSPMNGTISQLNIERGERVLGSGFSQGTNIMTVADLSQMEADVEADENDVVLVSMGDKASVKLDAFNNKVFEGIVTEIGNSAKTKGLGTQEEVVNFEIKITLQELNDHIRPGMSCNADIETETKNDVLAVPIQSVTARSENPQPGDNQTQNENSGKLKGKKKNVRPKEVVFVVKGNKAVMKEVKIGISDDTYIEITEGVKPGDEVVSGSYKAISKELKNDSKVIVKNKKDAVEKG